MRHLAVASLLLSSLPLCAAPRLDEMDRKIRERIARFPGKVFLFAKNLDTGVTYSIGGDERLRTASTIKVPIMVEAFAQAEAGKFRWQDTMTLTEEDMVSGSGVLREMSPGLRIPLRDLVRLMIVVSDNTATNLVLDRITADAVNARMDALGLKQTRSLRKILGDGKKLKAVASGHSREGRREEYQRFGIGVSTPREMVRLLELLDQGRAVSPAASAEMIAILKREQYADGIGRTLPDAEIASKSGALDHLRADIGIVYAKSGKVAMAITCEDIPGPNYTPENPGLHLISAVSVLLVEGLASANPAGNP